MKHTLRNWTLSAALPLLALACGGGGGGGDGGGGGSATGATDFLITDATVDGLLSFTVKVQSLQLIDSATGALSLDVLDEDLTIELIGAGLAPRWVSRMRLPVGTYSGVRASIDASSTVARNLTGGLVAVTHMATTFDTSFAAPITISSTNYQQVTLDIDLGTSLTGDAATPPITFNPTGILSSQSGGGATIGIDEVEGTVRTVNGTTDFVIDAFADDDRLVPLGQVTIAPAVGALLLDDSGIAYANTAAFFAALVANSTAVEVHGDLIGGTISANRIEVEGPDDNVVYSVKLEGLVQNVDTTLNTFDLVVIEVEKGAAIANPLLTSLGNPISCDYDDATAVFLLDENVPTTEASLTNGQRIKAKFATFIGEPFRAVLMEIEGQPEFEGVITSLAGLPTSLTMHLLPGNPALGGSVATTTTDVTVNLAGSTLYLDTEGDPVLTTPQLSVGLNLEVRGAISGPNTAPIVAASRTEIHAGRARGLVTSVSPGVNQFTFTISQIEDSFGGSVTVGPATATIDAACYFDDDASNASEFYALFNGLLPGESLAVKVEGISLPSPNQLRVYEVEARVED